MKVYNTNEIKNISLIGAKGSGKTTLIEAALFGSGVIKRRGSVDAGTTASDYFPVEKEYGYSVFSSIFNLEINNKKLNIIDCPGADDFVGNTYTALGVTDLGLIVVNAENGVEVGTENIYRTTAKLKKPIAFALNNMEGEKVDFDNIIESLKEHFGAKVTPVQFPVHAGTGFNAVVDVILMKKLEWPADGGKATVIDIPADLIDKAEEYRNNLLEAAAENDEALMEKFFEEGDLTTDEVREGMRKGLCDRSLYPVVCCSAKHNIGVDRLLEFLSNVAPDVADMPAPVTTEGVEVKADSNGPTSLFFFKTSVEQHIGEVSYFKVMSGTLKAGDDLDNATRGGKERLAQIFVINGNTRVAVDELKAGDIGAAVKLKDVRTGNTLDAKGIDWQFDFIKYPAPKYSRAIKPLNEADAEKLAGLLTKMHEEDPTWLVEQSKELKQTIVSGQGEFHLRTLKWRLENNDKMNVEFLETKIPYRETITKAARADYRHKKQSGGSGQFGEVHLIVEPYTEGMPEPDTYKFGNQEFKMNVKDKQEIPLEWGGKLVVYNCIVGGAIDARFIPAIIKGLMDRIEQGPLTGSYARDVRVMIYDGKMHPVDSN